MDFMVFMAKMFVFFFPGVLTGFGLAHCRNRGQRKRSKNASDKTKAELRMLIPFANGFIELKNAD